MMRGKGRHKTLAPTDIFFIFHSFLLFYFLCMKSTTSFLLAVFSGIALTLSAVSLYLHAPSADTDGRETFSQALENSLFPQALAGFGTSSSKPWANYTSWPSSNELKEDDTMYQSLYTLYFSYSNNQNNTQSLTDINGDGLIDILFYYYSSISDNVGLVLINNGNLGFDLVYKCYYDDYGNSSSPATRLYYGDCADVSS